MSDKIKKHLSDCCNAPLKIISADEGTSHYECEKCGKSCNDIYYYNTEECKIPNVPVFERQDKIEQEIGKIVEETLRFINKPFMSFTEDTEEDRKTKLFIIEKKRQEIKLKSIADFIEKKLNHISQLSREEERDRIREIFEKDKIIYCTLHTSNDAYELCDVCSLGKKIKDRILQTLTAKQDE